MFDECFKRKGHKSKINTREREQGVRHEDTGKTDAQRQFLNDYPQAAKMLKNIKGNSDNEKLESLKEEFMKSEFEYTMNATSPDKFLSGKADGDCSTLARAYVKIATEYFGIKSVTVGKKSGDFFVPNGGRVLDIKNATGNVDNGQHSDFSRHVKNLPKRPSIPTYRPQEPEPGAIDTKPTCVG